VKIPFDLSCIIESIRDMFVDISCRKCLGVEEDLCMPVILQLLLCWLVYPPHHVVGQVGFSFMGSLVYNVKEQHSVKIL
jgi:hypothetical protein